MLLSGTYMNKDLYKIREFFQVKARFPFFFFFFNILALYIRAITKDIYYFNFSGDEFGCFLVLPISTHTEMTAENARVILVAPCHRRLRSHYSKKGFHRWESISHMPTMFFLLLLLPPQRREIDR